MPCLEIIVNNIHVSTADLRLQYLKTVYVYTIYAKRAPIAAVCDVQIVMKKILAIL